MDNNMKEKQIKRQINDVLISGYSSKINISDSDSLVDIVPKLAITAIPVESDNKIDYEFVLDTRFLKEKVIKYDEMKMVCEIIDILESNREYVLSKIEEYKEEQENGLKIAQLFQKMFQNELDSIVIEVDEIIDSKCTNVDKIIDVFDRMYILEFIDKNELKKVYYKLFNYVKKFDKELVKEYEEIFIKKFNKKNTNENDNNTE